MQAEAVIPSKKNRIIQRTYDKYIYKERNMVERLFNKLKNFRKLATRYEKIQKNFEALICLACSFLWLI
jgi:transposase